MPTQKLSSKHTYDVSMKARPKGHSAITCTAYKVAEVHPTSTTKNNSSYNTALLRLLIIIPIGKT